MFGDVTFAYPWVLFFLILVPSMLVWYWYKGKKKQPSIKYSSLKIFSITFIMERKIRYLPAVLRALAVGLLIVAFARPQTYSSARTLLPKALIL